MSDRLKIITDRGNLSTEELCRLALTLNCHHLDRIWGEYLRVAYITRDPEKMEKALLMSSKTLALTYHQNLTPVEWDFWLALRTWRYDALDGKSPKLQSSAQENTVSR